KKLPRQRVFWRGTHESESNKLWRNVSIVTHGESQECAENSTLLAVKRFAPRAHFPRILLLGSTGSAKADTAHELSKRTRVASRVPLVNPGAPPTTFRSLAERCFILL